MRHDWHDLALSTDEDAAVAALDAAVRGFVGYEAHMPRRMERLGQAAPGLALAHVFRGCMIMTAFRARGRHPVAPEFRSEYERAAARLAP